VLRGAFGADLPHGQLRDRLRRAGDGDRHRLRRGGCRIAQQPHRRRARGRPHRREAHDRLWPCAAGLVREPLCFHPRPRELLRPRADVRVFLRRGDAPLRHSRARIFRCPDRIMGTMFGAVNMASTLGMAIAPWSGGWLHDAYGSYFWLYIGSFGIRLGAVA
jgi:hypothetical protein